MAYLYVSCLYVVRCQITQVGGVSLRGTPWGWNRCELYLIILEGYWATYCNDRLHILAIYVMEFIL